MNRAFFAVAVVAVAVGCTATVTPGEGVAEDSADLGKFCQSYCTHIHMCDGATSSIDVCTSGCVKSNGVTFQQFRPDAFTLVDQCVGAKDCKSVLSPTVVASCSREAAATVAASDAASKLCDALAASDSKCGRTSDRAACLENAKLYTDGALSQAQSCTSKACDEVFSCVASNLAVLAPAPVVKGCPPCDTTLVCKSSTGAGGGPMSLRTSGGRCVTNAGYLECDGTVSSRANGKKVGTWKTGEEGSLVIAYDGAATYTCERHE